MSELGIEFEDESNAHGARGSARRAVAPDGKPKMILWLNRYGCNDAVAQGVLISVSVLFFGISIVLILFHFVF